MVTYLVSNPILVASIVIFIAAAVKIAFIGFSDDFNQDRFWRAIGGSITSSIVLVLFTLVLAHNSMTVVAMAVLATLFVHWYINWTIGLWRDRRDRHYPYVLRNLRKGRGVHFYKLVDVVSHVSILSWLYYSNSIATLPS